MSSKVQSARAIFDGTQDSVDLTWGADFAASTFSLGVSTPGTGVVEAAVTIDNPGSTRIEPTARFTGTVDVIRTKV